MSHYRDLNKELVEQVQTMRVNMKLYCDEIISLKAELMQKYESELFLRKYCYNWALDNFQQFIQTIQPDSEILPLLKQHVPGGRESINRRSSSPLRSRASDRIRSSGEKSSGERRRSTQLTMEFQRSNSIITTRNSVRSCSPIRRSCGDEEGSEEADEEQGEQEVGVSEENRVSEEQSNINQVEQPAATEVTETVPETNVEINRDVDLVIYEESEEEDVQEEDEEEDDEEVEDVDKDEEELQQSAEDKTEESQGDEDQDVESVYESVEEVTVNTITKTRNTLTDITNTSVNLSNSNNISKSLRKRGRPRKHPTEQDSLTDTDTDMEVSAVVSRRIHRTKRVTDNSIKDIENTTVQEPRRHSNTRAMAQITNKSIPTTHNLSQTCGEGKWKTCEFYYFYKKRNKIFVKLFY